MAAKPDGLELESQYDVLPKMIPFLDRHLIYPIVADFEPSDELTKFKFELLKETNMTDFVGGLDQEIRGLSEPSKDYDKKREDVLKKRAQLEDSTSKIRDLLGDSEVIQNLRSDKVANLNYLKETHGVTEEMVEALYNYGQFQYSCGAYAESAELLYQFRVLSTDNDKVNAATWGKLASEILSTEWEPALEEITKVKESIESRLYSNSFAQLQSRTWLIHWSLFPFFNFDAARDTLTDMFFQPAFINTIQTLCPWILRYLTAAVITNRSRNRHSNTYQKQLKDLIRVVRQEGYEYSDPLTDFVRALYLDFDFEEAQKKLSEAEQLLREDFFLTSSTDAFVDSARHLISESYCKIHQRIDIKDLSARLGLSEDEGEKWIVNLIRDTRVDAKIDYQAGTVDMNHPPQSVYQQVIERTKGGFFRTQVLSAAVAK
ncbi:eukaryotic translation initiation factor-like protein 3 subunit E [Microthyrium microscopicum]|uniref:Eukaryotic translation initiation factor 3 subunit E n=1 Tax=Microthyrium microscopicum TaxID=703497 RepID=A0A6A6U4K4_9PEZI|nr:eukaryotic translation initiation factor-like protein 3 subunit E [Microthyrium microscopicum]